MDGLKELLTGVDISEILKIWGLIFARIQPIIIQIPFLGGKPVLGRMKVAVAIFFAVFMTPLIRATLPGGGLPATVGPYFFLLAKEVAIGFTIGYIAALVFHAVMTSGRLLDMARGASMANMMDPLFGEQASVMGVFQFQVVIQIVLLTNLHLVLLSGFFTSFELLPITSYPTFGEGYGSGVDLVIKLTAYLWVVAIQLNLPAFIMVFFTDAVIGIVGRISPQIKVMILAIPVKMLMGVLMVMLVMTLLVTQIEGYLVEFLHMPIQFIKLVTQF